MTEKPEVRERYPLQDAAVYGPIHSRRLGYSLGINPLPVSYKFCNFDCVYCQYGFTPARGSGEKIKKLRELLAEIGAEFEKHRQAGTRVDCLTVAGNGEPTLYPDFPGFVDGLCALRDRFYPGVKIGILSNASLVDRPEIFDALCRVDERYMKLDAGSQAAVGAVNRPKAGYRIEKIIEALARLPGVVIQSLFVSGPGDNTHPRDVDCWIERIAQIRPREVQVYSIDRTPADLSVVKVSGARLREIADLCRERAGVPASVFE